MTLSVSGKLRVNFTSPACLDNFKVILIKFPIINQFLAIELVIFKRIYSEKFEEQTSLVFGSWGSV